MTPRARTPLLAALLDALANADETSKRELAEHLRPYLADDPGRLLNAVEKAEQLGLHPDTVARMARAGRLAGVKVGKSWRFRADRSEIQPVGGNRTPAPPSLTPPRRPARAGVPASVTAIRGAVAGRERQ